MSVLRHQINATLSATINGSLKDKNLAIELINARGETTRFVLKTEGGVDKWVKSEVFFTKKISDAQNLVVTRQELPDAPAPTKVAELQKEVKAPNLDSRTDLTVRLYRYTFALAPAQVKAEGKPKELWSTEIEDFASRSLAPQSFKILDAAVESDKLIYVYRQSDQSFLAIVHHLEAGETQQNHITLLKLDIAPEYEGDAPFSVALQGSLQNGDLAVKLTNVRGRVSRLVAQIRRWRRKIGGRWQMDQRRRRLTKSETEITHRKAPTNRKIM